MNQSDEGSDYRKVALSIASLGTLLSVLNASTLIIALPTIMVDLDTDLIGVMWVLISLPADHDGPRTSLGQTG